MSAFGRKLADYLLDRIWRAPKGLGRPIPPSVWDRNFANGQWDHLSEFSEAARYAIVRAYALRFGCPASVIDVGCGAGVLRKHFADGEVACYTGVDLSKEAVRLSAEMNFVRSTFVVADFDEYEPQTLQDVVIFNESIGYASDPAVTFARYWRCVRSGGACIVSMHDYDLRSRAAWKRIERVNASQHLTRVTNERGQSWDIKVFLK